MLKVVVGLAVPCATTVGVALATTVGVALATTVGVALATSLTDTTCLAIAGIIRTAGSSRDA